MPRNGSGTYSPPAGNPVIAGTVISSAVQNNTINDIGNELTNSLPRDGTAPPTGNLTMGNFKITGIGAATLATDVPQYQQIQSGASLYLTAVSGTNTIAGTLASPTLAAYAAGNTFRFVAAGTNTTATTININSLGAKNLYLSGSPLIAGQITSGLSYEIMYDGTNFNILGSSAPFIDSTALVKNSSDPTKLLKWLLSGLTTAATRTWTVQDKDITVAGLSDMPYRGFFAGLMLSPATTTSMPIAAGQCSDSTNTVLMSLSAITKTTAAWTVGTSNGGLDTGAIANSTWYHFYVIRRPDTGVTDVVFSLNATTPTLPANYTQYRRIGADITNGSGQWTAFIQDGDLFQWITPPVDVSSTNPGAAAVTRTLTVPIGVNVIANLRCTSQNTGGGGNLYQLLSDLSVTDQTPSSGNTDTATGANAAGTVLQHGFRISVRTNTSAQIRSRQSFSDANTSLTINTLGWTDTRGRNA
jgi:hypothetical protein